MGNVKKGSANRVRHTRSHNERFSLTLVKCADCNVERSGSGAPRSQCCLHHRCGAASPGHYGLFLLLPLTRISIHTVDVVLSLIPPNPSEMITSVKLPGFSPGHISTATERLLFFPIRNSDSQNRYIGFASGTCGKCKKADGKDLWNSRSNAANPLGCNTIAARCISPCP